MNTSSETTSVRGRRRVSHTSMRPSSSTTNSHCEETTLTFDTEEDDGNEARDEDESISVAVEADAEEMEDEAVGSSSATVRFLLEERRSCKKQCWYFKREKNHECDSIIHNLKLIQRVFSLGK